MRIVPWAVALLFVSAMVGMAVQPVRYHFLMEKEVADLPAHTSYRKAMEELLPAMVKGKAEAKKCRDFLIPPNGIEGNTEGLPNLLIDVRVALASHGGWKLAVDPSVKVAMRKRAEERFKTWGSMGITGEMMAQIKTQKSVAMKTRYSVLCSVQALSGGTEDRKVLVTVNDETLQSKLFDVSLAFMAPATFQRLVDAREAALSHLAAAKAKAVKHLSVLAGLGAGFVVYLLVWGMFVFRTQKKAAGYHAWLIDEIEKREDLIRNGHYVAALELAEEYLATFPKETEIKAFRDRLIDFTGGDPKKAQLAWVEAKKLESRLASAAPMENGRYLLPDEKRDIGGLLPYHPELKASYDRLLAMDDVAEKEHFAAADGRFGEVETAFRDGHLSQGSFLLDSFLKTYPDYPKATAMRSALSAQSPKRFVLKMGSEADVHVVAGDHLTLGRGDEGEVPDVVLSDRRISRRHLRLTLSEDGLSAGDLGSAGGTYLNGDPVTETTPLQVGDLLTLSRVINFDVSCIQKNGTGTNGAMLQGDELTLCLVERRLELGFSGGRVDCKAGRVIIWRENGTVWIATPKAVVIPAEKSSYRLDDTLDIREE